jgi:hypothetical protein
MVRGLKAERLQCRATMPRYFFQVYLNGEAASTDTEGVELSGDDAAFTEATASCGQMIHDLDGSLRAPTEWRMEVADVRGTTLFRLFFRAERAG